MKYGSIARIASIRPLIVAASMITGLTAPAVAASWQITVDDDPMTDQKTVYVAAPNDGATARSGVVIAIKCWAGRPDDTALIIGTNEPWDEAANYKEVIGVKLRVDKNEPISLDTQPQNVGGRFTTVADPEVRDPINEFIRQVGKAKTRIALEFGPQVLRFTAKGSKKAIDTVTRVCGSQGASN